MSRGRRPSAAPVLLAAVLSAAAAHAATPTPGAAAATARPGAAAVADAPAREIHQRIALAGPEDRRIALTLDLCSGGFDVELAGFLIRNRIPATLFATRRWIDRNPDAVALLRRHADLFGVENHGEHHVPAVVGRGRRVYGIPGHPDLVHLRREIDGGAQAIQAATGSAAAPRWYRAATARYDAQALAEIERRGLRVAGFSVNADGGATLSRAQIEQRLARVRSGDIILAHLNHPEAATGAALRTALLALRAQGLRFVRLDEVTVRTVD